MKHFKPGQLATINNVVYRAKRRKNGCQGCSLNDITCPNIVDSRIGKRPLACSLDDVIFIRM